MSREYNYGGTSLIVDSIEEIFESGAVSTKTVNNIKQIIGQQRQSKDINKLKEQIGSAAEDGTISASEKPGLKREWASLQSSYASISDKFAQDESLENNTFLFLLKETYEQLSPIMGEILSDMDTDYTNKEKVSQITKLFVDCWDYIAKCTKFIEDKMSLSDRFSIQVSAEREIVSTLSLSLKLLFYSNGSYVDVTYNDAYDNTDFVWRKTSDESFLRTGRTLNLSLSDFSSNEETFSVTFKHVSYYEDANNTEFVVEKSINFSVYTGTLSQWAWSDAETKESLFADPLKVWTTDRTESNGKKYLWRRDTKDLLKIDSEKEWTYFRESGLNGTIGKDGYSRAQLTLYKRSASGEPTKDDLGTITYTFATNAYAGELGGWSKTIPTGTGDIYAIYASALFDGETDTISPNEWTTPAKLSTEGAKGESGMSVYTIILFKRSSDIPSTPSGNVTYNFHNNVLSGADGWQREIPTSDGNPLYVITATAASRDETDIIYPSEWSAPSIYVVDGKDGDDGKPAKMLRIVADSNVIRFNSSNIPYDGSKASLSLQTSGLSSTSASWTVDGTSKGVSETLDIYPEDFERDWISSTASSTARMRCIAQADNIIMIGGVSGALVYSTDNGNRWTTVPAFTSGIITGLCYNNGKYVAVVAFSTSGAIYSSDNISSGWTEAYTSANLFNAITTDGSVFVAVGEKQEGIICKSSDGVNWETIEGTFPNFYAICYDSKKFHAVGAGGIVWASEDGARWTQTANIGFDCRGISYDGKYIAGGQDGNIAYSNDGKNWYMGTVKRTSTATVSHIRAIASKYGVYYSVCYLGNGYGEIWKSHNGRDWEVCFEPNETNTRLWAISFSNGYMIASGDNGNVYRLPLPRSLLVKAESEGYSDTISIVALQDAIGTSGADGHDGVGIKSAIIDYQVSTSATEVPTGAWLDDIPEVPNGSYLWTRTSITYTNDTSSTSYSISYFSKDGEPAEYLKVSCWPQFYTLNGRGVNDNEQAIDVTIDRTFIPMENPCYIKVSTYKDDAIVDAGKWNEHNASSTYRIEIPLNITYDRIIVEVSCGTWSKAISIDAVISESKNGEKQLGVVYLHNNKLYKDADHTQEITHLNDNLAKPFIDGDYALVQIGENLIPYRYTDGFWTALSSDITNGQDYANIMLDTLVDVLNSNMDVKATMKAHYAFIGQLAAQTATIERIFSKHLKVLEGGSIYSGGFDENGDNKTNDPGFHFSSDGKLQAVGATLKSVTVNGSIDCSDGENSENIVLKTAYGKAGSEYVCSSKTRWSHADLCAYIALGSTGNCTYNGSSYSYKRTNSSNPHYIFNQSLGIGQVESFTALVPMSIYYEMPSHQAGFGYIQTKLYLNDTIVVNSSGGSTKTGTLSLAVGDIVSIENPKGSTGASNYVKVSVVDDAVVLYDSYDVPVKIFKNEPMFESTSASIGGFVSSSQIKYATADGWFGVPSGGIANSVVNINGNQYVINAASNNGTTLVLTATNGASFSFTRLDTQPEVSKVGWYNISGSITAMAENRGVTVESLYPVNPNTTQIGTEDKRFTGFFSGINVSGSITANKVWGAVFN